MWDPQKVQADLKSRFGFDDLHAERILNYSAELQEVHVLDSFSGLGFLSKRPQNLLVGPQDGSSLIELWLLGHGGRHCVWLFYKCCFPLTCLVIPASKAVWK